VLEVNLLPKGKEEKGGCMSCTRADINVLGDHGDVGYGVSSYSSLGDR
jgi:hypothetical protein